MGTGGNRFPGETESYRQARNELLKAEAELRGKAEDVAALRRALPLGGTPDDYVFARVDDGEPVRLSELFADGKDTLLLYNFMYGPDAEQACPACTSFLDAFDGIVPHLADRLNVAVVAKSAPERIHEHANVRGWRNLVLLSSNENSFNRDYLGEDEKGGQNPVMHVFVRRDGEVRHFWSSELLFRPHEEGMHPRHIDMIWPLWNSFDLTPEGRGTDWFPRLSYD